MTSRIRFGVALLFFIIGMVLHIQLGISDAWYLYVASLLLGATHFWFGNVWAAFAHLQKGNLLKAEILLNQTRYPHFLLRRPRAYYYLCYGILSLKEEDWLESKIDLETALELGLRTDTDTALAHLNLAHIHYKQQEIAETKQHLSLAKEQATKDLLIQKGIEELEGVLGG